MEYIYPLDDVRYVSTRQQRSRMATHASTSAILAVFLAALWVVNYLVTSDLWDDVLLSPGMINTPAGGKAMFIVLTRFLVGFGLTWIGITVSLAAYSWFRDQVARPLSVDEDEDPRF